MQAKVEVYAMLVRQCRLMRMAPDVDRARASLDVEQELVGLMLEQGMAMPETPVRGRTGRRRRPAPTPTPEPAAVTGGAE
jgi:hypothetical protein